MTGFGDVAESLRRSTVQVLGEGVGRGAGSGIIWKSDGQVLTNAHVITGGAQVELSDGRRFPARVIRQDRRRDLALLQISASGLAAANIGDSGALRAGELAIAVGNPLGFTGAVSTGVIQAVGPLAGFGLRHWVQTDVRLAPGNSGGPLANARGDVIGVNTMIAQQGGQRMMALAIPSAEAVRFLSKASGPPRTLGVTVRPVPLREDQQIGLLILEIDQGGAADQASLLPGDILIGVGDQRFTAVEDLEDALDAAPNGLLKLAFRRGGGKQDRSTAVLLRERRAAAA